MKKVNGKLIFLVLIVFLLASSLSACGGNDSEEQLTEDQKEYQEHVEEKYGNLDETIEITEDEVKLTKVGIEENLELLIIDNVENYLAGVTSEIITINENSSIDGYESEVIFDYGSSSIKANICFNKQGDLIATEIVGGFSGEFNQECYDAFCKIVGCIMIYQNDTLYKEAMNLMPIPSNQLAGTSENEYGMNYTYDIKENGTLCFSYYEEG